MLIVMTVEVLIVMTVEVLLVMIVDSNDSRGVNSNGS